MTSPSRAKHERASARVADWIATARPDARAVKVPSYSHAWELELEIAGARVAASLCLPEDFPVQDPVVIVKDAERFWGRVPHVERSGKLCLSSTNAVHGVEHAVSLVEGALADACGLLANPSPRDFAEEFNSYWPSSDPKPPDAVMLCRNGLPKEPWCRKNDSEIVLGDDRGSVDSWCDNTGRAFDEAVQLHRIDLEKPMLPVDFPSDLKGLHTVLLAKDQALANMLQRHMRRSKEYLVLPLRIVVAGENKDAVIGVKGTVGSLPMKGGFRSAQTVPWTLIEQRAPQIQRILLRPATPQAVTTRSGDGFDLSDKRVVLVGCGSLGGYLAQMLARASVGQLTLVDDDALGWQNTGRHVLGAAYVGKNKAAALKAALGVENPHVKLVAIPKKVELVLRDRPEVLKDADIVISATGDWPVEYALNYWRTYTSGAPPLLFTWLEPHAVAGHSFHVGASQGGCLNCYFSASGHFTNAVIGLDNVEPQKEASCAGFYQPYGATDMLPTVAMTAAHAVDVLLGRERSSTLRTWTGARTRFELHAVSPNQDWTQQLAAAPFGCVHERPMPPVTTCPLCF